MILTGYEAILREVGCLEGAETLRSGFPTPTGSTWEDLYIDDQIAVQKCQKGTSRTLQRDDETLSASRQHYRELQIPVSSKKAVAKAYDFQAWGTHVDSSSGRVGAPLEKLRHLVVASRQFLQLLPGVNRKLLQRLVGLFVHPFMHRRERRLFFKQPKGSLTACPNPN